jgi:Na+-driven multidrug efflux pump
MPSNALAASMSAMAAINIGAGRWDRVEKIAWRGCALSLGCATAATLLILGLDDIVLLLFIPEGGEVLAIAQTINRTALWGWIALSVSLGLFAVVRANGAMLAPALTFAATMWLFRVPFALLLQPLMGAAAIWWSFPFGSLSSGLLAYAYYRWGGWRSYGPMLAKVK